MTEEAMRMAFHAELRKKWTSGYGCSMNAKGKYVDQKAQEMWELWQAATRAAVPAWQPIEAAPKDGTAMLAMLPDSDLPHTVRWSIKDGCWCMAWDHYFLVGLDVPTRWQPLPPAPEVHP